MYEALIDLLTAARDEFTKINLADTSRNLQATGATCDSITGVVARREAARRESTQEGRA
jgi:hypothetical protein